MASNDFSNGVESNGSYGDFPSLSGNGSAPQAQRDTSAPSSGLSAAQRLQQAHEAQEAPSIISEDPFPPFKLTEDPFPVAKSNDSTPAPSTRKAKPVDISDESAFPSLGGGNAGKKAATWGSGGGAAAQRIKQQESLSASTPSSRPATPSSLGGDEGFSARSNVASATVTLASAEIHIQAPAANSGFAIGRGRGTFSNERQTEPTTLGEVMKLLMKRHPTVTVEASTSRQTTTFIIKGKGDNAEEKVAQVKRELLARLAKKVTVEVEVPASLRGFIVGAKGRTLKAITESTGAQVQLPSRDSTADAEEPEAEDAQDGPLVTVTISGDSNAVSEARAKIMAIVSERASKVTKQLDSIPKEFWPLLNGAKGAKMNELIEAAGATGSVSVFVPRSYEQRGVPASGEVEEDRDSAEKFVTVTGDRDGVTKVVQAIEAEVANLKRNTTSASIGINKRQHRFLVGAAGDEILEETGCSVEIPPIDDANENVTIRGPQAAIIGAFQIVMNKANATPIETLDLTTAHAGSHDRKQYASSLTRYVLRQSKFRTLSSENNVQVYMPRQSAIDAGTPLIEIVGKEGANIPGARQAIIAIVRKLPPSNFTIVDVDSLVHRHLNGKNGKNIKAFQSKGVEVVFPPEGEDRSDVLLVYSGEGESAKALEEVKSEIATLVKEAADIKSTTISIPKSLHGNIIGQSGTTLNAIIGEEKNVNVSFGSSSSSKKGGANEDDVVIRGPSEEVERVKKAIERVAEDAKNEEIVNSHVLEFEIETVHVRHVVGKAGSGIQKLRDDLGVRVDIEERGGASAAPAADSGAAKKRSAPAAGGKSKVTIKGRKENAEEAKKRILSNVTRIADEVTVTIPLPSSLERGSLIGKQGTYLKRLEEKYEVRINFPRDGRKGGDDDETPRNNGANSNEITIRGGKKGAADAKGELVALIAYEQENGNVVTFTVSVKALPRILGKAGSQVNQIKEDTGVQSVDVDQQGDEATTATVTLRGTKSGTKKAREAIEAIAKEVDNEARFTIQIPREYHTTLIGSGGSSIRELIVKAGGPTDARLSGNTVRFPRQGDASQADNVVITAPKAVAEKIRTALEKEVESLKSRIVYGVAVPQSQHASIIGKGASAVQELQRKHGVKVTMPSWNEYAQAGEITNPEDVKDAPASDVIKIVGPREAAIAAAADLSKGRPASSTASRTIFIPTKYHAKIAQGGRFFRSLPSGTRVTHEGQKPPSSKAGARKPPASASASASGTSTPTARIDDDTPASGEEQQQQEVEFQLVALYSDAEGDEDESEESSIPWVINSTSEEDAQRVLEEIEKALEQARRASHVGWVTVPRGLMPRIVGRGGSGLDQLRSHGVEVEVVGKRDSNQLTLTGTPAAIDQAHQQILRLAAPRPPRQQYNNRRGEEDERY